MDLSLTEQEQLLKDSVLTFVEREATTTALVDLQESDTGFEAKWLSSMADAGGVGANAMEAAIICEALGRGPVPGPFMMSSVVSAAMIRATERTPARDSLLT